jgi:hypothetical protein
MKENSKYIKYIIVNYLKTNIESELSLFEHIDKTNEVRSGDVICSKKIINDVLSELEIEGLISLYIRTKKQENKEKNEENIKMEENVKMKMTRFRQSALDLMPYITKQNQALIIENNKIIEQITNINNELTRKIELKDKNSF